MWRSTTRKENPKPDFVFLYQNPKTDFESIESILRTDSTDQIQIWILGIHDLSVSLRKDSKRILVASGIQGN